jgi:hypothetical protein
MSISKFFLRFIILAFVLCSFSYPKGKFIVYLTCVDDPSHAMTVQWHSFAMDYQSTIDYRKKGSQDWSQANGEAKKLDKFNYLVHRVDLIGLEPNTEYEFTVQGSDKIYFVQNTSCHTF